IAILVQEADVPTQQDVSQHYTHGNLVAAIRGGVESLGKTINSMTVDDLAPVDEFHIGGRQASEDFLSQLDLTSEKQVLDVGCGLGGAARFVASHYGCQVTGIDLTPEFIETGKVLCGWVGLDSRISLRQGSALEMPFADRAFDRAYMLHVAMNIDDKAKLCSEVSRVLRPNSLFGIYDVMRIGVAERNRRDFALAFFDQLRAKTAAAGGPPPLGLHILMGRNTPDKVQNMIANISTGRIAPVEMIARKS